MHGSSYVVCDISYAGGVSLIPGGTERGRRLCFQKTLLPEQQLKHVMMPISINNPIVFLAILSVPSMYCMYNRTLFVPLIVLRRRCPQKRTGVHTRQTGPIRGRTTKEGTIRGRYTVAFNSCLYVCLYLPTEKGCGGGGQRR